MKNKLSDLLTCGLFCGFLGAMLVLFLVLPKDSFSQREKRVLNEAPDTSLEAILSGKFGTQAESYIADHVPGRDFFVGLASYYDLLSGRQVTKDIYLATGDRLVEKPNVYDEAVAQKNMRFINSFAQTIGQKVDLMLVPSAGYAVADSVIGLHGEYVDDTIIESIYALAGESVRPFDLTAVFAGYSDPGALYYRTDHHWTALGAYTAYSAYMEALGRAYPAQNEFTVESHDGFYGSTHSRAGLWLVKPEPVELWDGGKNLTVTSHANVNDIAGTAHEGVFYRENLEALDKYTVYLGGNQPLVRIHNPEGEGKLLVIRDSYANCLGTLLANTYQEVVLVDLRYWKTPVSELVAAEGFDDVLVCYSLYNFLTDVNFPWLK